MIATSPNSFFLFAPFGGGRLQVEMNVDFVQKKRDEVPFSPKDHSVESFLQVISLIFSSLNQGSSH